MKSPIVTVLAGNHALDLVQTNGVHSSDAL